MYELSDVHNVDAPIFAAMGRGILHGYIPYQDLFETKPPGIFLLHAFSLRLFASDLFVRLLQIFILVALPFIIALTVNKQRMAVFLFGCVASLYLAYESGEMQVESFGAFFCALFLLGYARIGNRWLRIGTGALCFALAIGMKEPFLFSIIAAVLILNPKQLPSMLLSMAIGTVIGILFMWYMGYLWPYLNIYIPYMTGFHSHRAGSPLLRMFNFLPIVKNLWQFSPFFFALIVLLIGACVYALWKEKRWLHIASIAAALLMISFVVGVGGDYVGHHFIFALPAYIALAILASRLCYFYYSVPLLLLCVLLHAPTPYERIEQVKAEDARTVAMAQTIDGVLDRCAIDRYRIVGDLPFPVYGYTKHVPLGPAFFQYSLYVYETGFKESFIENVVNAEVIVMGKKNRYLPNALLDYINQNFTSEPPRCAGSTNIEGIYVLFRKPS